MTMKIAISCTLFVVLMGSLKVDDRLWQSIVARNLCVTQAIARAVADVNVPMLTNYHLTKTGQTITLAERR
jgi:hypothetical protein